MDQVIVKPWCQEHDSPLTGTPELEKTTEFGVWRLVVDGMNCDGMYGCEPRWVIRLPEISATLGAE